MKFVQEWRTGVFLFACATVLLAPMQKLAAEPYLTSDMLSDCRAVTTKAKAKRKSDEIELDNTFQTGSCWGAFLSIQQLITLKAAGANNPIFRVCAPEELTLLQIIQTFESYARRHPDQQNEPFTVVALNALHNAFPCR